MTELTDRITVVIDGKEREILMSFGLRQALAKLVGDPSRLGGADLELEEKVLLATVALRSPSGKIQHGYDSIEDLEISIEDAERLSDWALKHVLDFFVTRVTKTFERMKAQDARLPAELKDL